MDNRQTEMALMPPRVEDQELSPRSEPGQGLDIGDFTRESFESALERFKSAGDVEVDPEDPVLYNAYRRSIDYIGDMALGGLDLSDAAFRAAVGIAAQALPEDQERRFARDLAGMPEAFLGVSPGRIAAATDEVMEGVAQVGRNLTRRDEMPVLGSNLGNVGVRDLEEEVLPDTVRPARQTPPRSQINPLFRDQNLGDSPLAAINPELNFIASFYSPLRSAVRNMPIAREGSTGETIMAYLNKRAPNVSSSELRFSGLDLDPNERYTREDVLSRLRYTADDTLANLSEYRPRNSSLTSSVSNLGQGVRFRKEQPQNVVDRQDAYFEITLDSDSLPRELVPGVTTHHGETTLAHTRGSINTDEDGQYILVWEFQSDPLQNLGKVYNEYDGYAGPDSFSGTWLDENLRDLKAGFFGGGTQATPNEALLRDVIEMSFSPNLDMQGLREFYKDKYNIDVSGNSLEGLHRSAIRQTTQDIDQNFEDYVDELFDEMGPEVVSYRRGETSLSQGEIPFSTNTQYVKNLVLSLVARAKMDNIDRIVIPPIEEIARQRVGTGSFETLEDAVKALRPTYVDAVRKAVNIINNEANGSIRVGTQTLEYPTAVAGQRTRSATGTLLDISDFDFDPQTQAARFAEGGAVTMERQMDFFEEGGMMDDGATKDPVSGNEVPSGSMAEEVRDDVPAMLSEGEYVVPADVVRYYGLGFFESIRDKAKLGLAEMEAEGRIGGEPVDTMPGDDDLSEDERAMLMEVMGMSQGGAVRGFQEGGYVYTPGTTMAPYGQPYTMPGMSVFNTPLPTTPETPAAATTTVTLYAPDGTPVTLTLPKDQDRYNELLAQGYTTEMPQQVNVAAATQPGGAGDGDSGPTAPGTPGSSEGRAAMAERTREALTQDPIQFGVDALGRQTLSTQGGARIGGALLGPVGMLIGGALGAATTANKVNQARGAALVAQELGYDTAELNTKIDEYIESLSGVSRFAANQATGQRFYENWKNDSRDMSIGGGLGREDFAEGELGDQAFAAVMAESAPAGMTYQPDTGGYIRTETNEERDARWAEQGVIREGTGPQGTPIYRVTPGSTAPRPVPRPSNLASATAPSSDSGGDSGSSSRGGFDSDSGGYSGPAAGDTSNIFSWAGDRDNDGVANWRDFNDGVGANDKNTDGGSSSSGSGKIVCTAMNTSYGFGSYRQAIWLKYSADNLTEYHEKGYHKIFLPLVDRAYNRGENNNMFIRKVLENIARHRTADLRAEMQGKKRDTVGRAYRAVLEPICYVVGRLSK